MASIREIKAKARRDLHQAMRVPALYILPGGVTPIPVSVRVHTQFTEIGTLSFSQFAERQETIPKIVFMRDEVDRPTRNAIVSIDEGEAYRIDNVLPPDGISVTVEVVRLSEADTVDLPVPEPV